MAQHACCRFVHDQIFMSYMAILYHRENSYRRRTWTMREWDACRCSAATIHSMPAASAMAQQCSRLLMARFRSAPQEYSCMLASPPCCSMALVMTCMPSCSTIRGLFSSFLASSKRILMQMHTRCGQEACF